MELLENINDQQTMIIERLNNGRLNASDIRELNSTCQEILSDIGNVIDILD